MEEQLASTKIDQLDNLYNENSQKLTSMRRNFFTRFLNRQRIEQLNQEQEKIQADIVNRILEIDRKAEELLEEKNNQEVTEHINQVKSELENEGLYLSQEVYFTQESLESNSVELRVDMFNWPILQRYDHNPSSEEVLSFVKENSLITKINPRDQKLLLNELKQHNFSIDEVPYSYSHYVSDLREKEGKPFVYIYDDTDAMYETLTYEPSVNKWIGNKYGFSIENSLDSIKEVYKGNDLATDHELPVSKFNEEKQEQFFKFYDALELEEQQYLQTYNENILETLVNVYSEPAIDREHDRSDSLKEQAARLESYQIDQLVEKYTEFVSPPTSDEQQTYIEQNILNFTLKINREKSIQQEANEDLSRINQEERMSSAEIEYLKLNVEKKWLQETDEPQLSAIERLNDAMNAVTIPEEKKIELTILVDSFHASYLEESFTRLPEKYSQQELEEVLSAVEFEQMTYQKEYEKYAEEHNLEESTIEFIRTEYKTVSNLEKNREQSVNESTVETHSMADKEFVDVAASMDLQEIAKRKAIENQERLEALKRQSEQEENDTDKAVALYMQFLTTDTLQREERYELQAFDTKHSSFDQLQMRLEAIDKVKSENPERDLSKKEKELYRTNGESATMNQFVTEEHKAMAGKERQEKETKSKTQERQQSFAHEMGM